MKDFFKRLYDLKPADENFVQMRAFAEKHGVPIMLADSEQLLKTMIRIKKPAKILEIGTAIGYSGSLMLLCSPQSRLYTIEMDEQMIELATQNFKNNGVDDRVTLFKGDAREIVHKMTGEYDFIFLDGPKRQYVDFLPYLKSMLKKDGILMSDNVLFHGFVEGLPRLTRKHRAFGISTHLNMFLDKLMADDDFESVILEIGDGVALSVKK